MRPTRREPARVAVTISSVDVSAGVSPPTSTAPPRNGAAAASCTAASSVPAATRHEARIGAARSPRDDGAAPCVAVWRRLRVRRRRSRRGGERRARQQEAPAHRSMLPEDGERNVNACACRRTTGISGQCAAPSSSLAVLACRSPPSPRARLDDARGRRAEHGRSVAARHAAGHASSSRGTRRSAGRSPSSRNHGPAKVARERRPGREPHAARAAAERRDPALLPERAGRRPPDVDRRRRRRGRGPIADAVAHGRAR